jgi:hypothetical protein
VGQHLRVGIRGRLTPSRATGRRTDRGLGAVERTEWVAVLCVPGRTERGTLCTTAQAFVAPTSQRAGTCGRDAGLCAQDLYHTTPGDETDCGDSGSWRWFPLGELAGYALLIVFAVIRVAYFVVIIGVAALVIRALLSARSGAGDASPGATVPARPNDGV